MTEPRDLGLSAYEEHACRSLLDTDPTTAKELSRDSGVSMDRVHDVVNDLEGSGPVRS